MKKYILIDVGDTIIHNNNFDFKKALMSIYLLSKNCNVSEDIFINESFNVLNFIFNERKDIEFKMIEYLDFLIKRYELTLDISLERLEEIFLLNSSDISFVDNIEKLLQYFKSKKYEIIVLSNTSYSKRVVCKSLEKLLKYFNEIIVSSESFFRKPNKNFFELGINAFGLVNKDNIYYIGNDYYYDVYGAYNSGIKCIWFNEKNEKPIDYLNVTPYLIIKSYEELIEKDF